MGGWSRCSLAEGAALFRVNGQRLGKHGPVVVGPLPLVEVEGGVVGLPEQEARQAALPAGADDQIRVGQAGRARYRSIGNLTVGSYSGQVAAWWAARRISSCPS